MPNSTFTFNNNGIGGTPFLSFNVDTTANLDFTQDDLDNNLTACVVSGNNEVGMGVEDNKLFGKVVWVSQQLQTGTTVPALCAVQARGVARFKYNYAYLPRVNQGVVVNGDGRVRGCHSQEFRGTGKVIAVDEKEGTCDVWLG